MDYQISPGGQLSGSLKVTGDKSISHRAVMFGSIAEGVTRITDLLEGEDVLATIQAFRQMGVQIQKLNSNVLEIEGVGLHGLQQPEQAIDLGNSGTAFRLLTGLLSGQSWGCELTGDDSLRSRPMGRIIKPLSEMGAQITAVDDKPPLQISPAQGLNGVIYEMPVASAQVKSALMLAGMYADGETIVSEPAPTRDHTERMLNGFGYHVERLGGSVKLKGGGRLTGCDITVPSDLSSAAFFMVGGLIAQNSEILIESVGINPSRNGIIPVLLRMGGEIELINEHTVGGEPVADIRVSSSSLKGCEIRGDDIPLAIDEIPILAVAAACASGVTQIRDAKELRVKESDRIDAVVKGLKAIGVNIDEHEDGMTITGGPIMGGTVDSHGDHRIAMAFSMAGLAAQHSIQVSNCDNVATSFPGFDTLASTAGLGVSVV